MKLADYLAAKHLTLAEFATKVQLSIPSISKLASGVNKPSLDTIQLIYDATDGDVTAEDFRQQHNEVA